MSENYNPFTAEELDFYAAEFCRAPLVERRAAARIEPKSRFREWLDAQTEREDPVGELARKLQAGGGIPSGDAWQQYAEGQETDEDELIEQWQQAWLEWDDATST